MPTSTRETLKATLAAIEAAHPHLQVIENSTAARKQAENALAAKLGELSVAQRNLNAVQRSLSEATSRLDQIKADEVRARRDLEREIGELQQRRDAEGKKLAEIIAQQNAIRASTKQLLTTIGGE
jgi:chromosome segregation ATPase